MAENFDEQKFHQAQLPLQQQEKYVAVKVATSKHLQKTFHNKSRW
jgi:hypothetical protein